MKLTEKFIKKYLDDFHYELTREQLEQEWHFDKEPYYQEKDCWRLRAKDGCWLEVTNDDLSEAFEGNCYFDPTCDSKKPSLEEIGKLDYQDSEYCAGVEHEKKVAIEACKKVIDKMYDSGFDPTIDYLEMFKQNL